MAAESNIWQQTFTRKKHKVSFIFIVFLPTEMNLQGGHKRMHLFIQHDISYIYSGGPIGYQQLGQMGTMGTGAGYVQVPMTLPSTAVAAPPGQITPMHQVNPKTSAANPLLSKI